jgi:hypothetical protein
MAPPDGAHHPSAGDEHVPLAQVVGNAQLTIGGLFNDKAHDGFFNCTVHTVLQDGFFADDLHQGGFAVVRQV